MRHGAQSGFCAILGNFQHFLMPIKKVHIKGPVSRDFRSLFFHQSILSKPLFIAVTNFRISFRICGDNREYVFIIRYADNSALCHIAHKHDFSLCRIAKSYDYAHAA
jgi:hypothetical protein